MLRTQARIPMVRTRLPTVSRRWASVGGSSPRPIREGAKELEGDVKRNQTAIAVAAVGIVVGTALWWKSAKTEGESKKHGLHTS
ncbi:hypothetical protein JCM10908_001373 [Rhodotorula pacifica]|uniref:uncharacterized protein n=1 Tax=Rhodotorula pacifica TaxID=1495444 RepID=UPI00317E8600